MDELSSGTLSFSPIARGKLAETVARRLLAELHNQAVTPGTRIPSERTLMELLGVGRSTVREAINGLAMLGVLEIRHGHGAFVLDATIEIGARNAIGTALARGVTRDLFEARYVVEVEVARLAAQRRTSADLVELEKALGAHEAALAVGRSAVGPSVEFHARVGAAAHNDVLASFVSSFVDVMTERGARLEQEPGYRQWELEQHRAVLEPIRARDCDLAQSRMRAHLDAVVPYHERLGLG